MDCVLFKDRMADALSLNQDGWVDVDGAMFELAVSLGILPTDSKYLDYKYLFWTDNKICRMLHAVLMSMVGVGFLIDRDGHGLEFKINTEFDVRTSV